MATTTPKTFTRDHTQPLTSEDYESYYVLTETSRRHRYSLRLQHPVRAIRHHPHTPALYDETTWFLGILAAFTAPQGINQLFPQPAHPFLIFAITLTCVLASGAITHAANQARAALRIPAHPKGRD